MSLRYQVAWPVSRGPLGMRSAEGGIGIGNQSTVTSLGTAGIGTGSKRLWTLPVLWQRKSLLIRRSAYHVPDQVESSGLCSSLKFNRCITKACANLKLKPLKGGLAYGLMLPLAGLPSPQRLRLSLLLSLSLSLSPSTGLAAEPALSACACDSTCDKLLPTYSTVP